MVQCPFGSFKIIFSKKLNSTDRNFCHEGMGQDEDQGTHVNFQFRMYSYMYARYVKL